ncbi:hypothetical protein CEUSTIGMA_g10837.t1 [Chlamydomonas eustigma]|uniref:t-SNARE coiled-coil homology domain-containing protein n=1 Tax=Chlamydomonas eustigma TaxID=1157962 RepID=A0A250XKG0_9CHLO|nr:hypothetical protein CEUSTIGMA_g10837.t1 [Chlamydomonas eustigma]|eukprot:GAX83412.1 hypothetical protein CEUSTIGMA_g10837.t1 [Chlamydomonas eustigma]
MSGQQDPFYLIRAEISSQYNEIQQKLHKFHSLSSSSQERRNLGREIDADCDSIKYQLDMLEEAVDTASQNPARFNLTMEEISSRRKWLDTTGRQIQGIKDNIKTITAAVPQVPSGSDRLAAANDSYLSSETQKQEMLIRDQDRQLEDIEKGVDNVTAMAKAIDEHLVEDDRLLTQLDGDIDTTGSRLRATSKKVQEIIRKSGTTSQLIVIIVLIVIVAILAYFVFT